jgi:hypothetical protein
MLPVEGRVALWPGDVAPLPEASIMPGGAENGLVMIPQMTAAVMPRLDLDAIYLSLKLEPGILYHET